MRLGAGPGLFIVAALAVAAIVFAIMAGPAPKDGAERAEAPVIAAPPEPFKSAYTGPQTAEEPPPDREIFAKIDAGKAAPAPGAPAPAKPAVTAPAPPKTAIADPAPAKPAIADPAPAKPAIADPAPAKPVAAAPAPTPAKVKAAPSFAADGPFQVQFGALGSEAAARSAYGALQARAGGALSGANLDVRPVKTAAGGTLFRLRVGFFPTRASADAFCQRMRALNQECMAVMR